MKRSTRLLAMVLSLLMIITSSNVMVFAANEPTITISNAQGKFGDTVDITVTLANNPGIVSMSLNVEYDSTALRLTGVSDSGLMPGEMHTDVYTKLPFPLTWENDTSRVNFEVNGVVATMTFEIITENVGNYAINVSIPRDGIYDVDADNVDFTIINGNVNVLSNHTHSMNHTPAVTATCKLGGNVEYWYCAGCNTYFADNNGNTVLTTITTEKDANNHVGGTEVRDAQPASCNTPGYTGDTYCLGCGVKTKTGTAIPATGDHVDANSKWETNGTHHWYTCGCGTEFDKAEHSGGTATCTAKAKCSVCQAEYGEKNAANHVGGTEVRDAQPASCNTPGYTGDTYCLGCGVKTKTGTAIPATGDHVDANNEWESDANGHWHTCGCGTKFDQANHSGGTATCKDKGTCSVCHYAYLDKDANNHAGGTEIRGYVPATEDADGYTGDTYCLGCGTKIQTGTPIPKHTHQAQGNWVADGNYHWHVCECTKVLDKADHTPSDWIIDYEATSNKDGRKHIECTICKYELESEAIPATGADWDQWYWIMLMIMNQKFNITAEASDGGTITDLGTSTVKYGNSKTFTIIPNEGYAVEAVYVNGKNVGAVTEYTFKNVRANQTISVEFAWVNPFIDIADDAEYIEAIEFVYTNGLFKGVSETEFIFAPMETMTRAMFVTVLGRLAEVDVTYYAGTSFDDVVKGEWYAPYVEWAAENGIVLGYGDGTFGINNKITIEQATVILARYAEYIKVYKSSNISIKKYADASNISTWALDAMKWAVDNDIYVVESDKLNPQNPAPRALIATMIYNFVKEFDSEK